MAHLTILNNVPETFQVMPKLTHLRNTRKRAQIIGSLGNRSEDIQGHVSLPTRRLVLGLASVALFGGSFHGVSLAEDNGLWLDYPLPVPSVENMLANQTTGTRSFLKVGLFMPDIGVKGSMYRLKKYAFDLLAMEDLVGPDTLNYVRKYLRLKCTCMYYDFDKVISAASVSDKQPLIDLATRFFDIIEKLEDAAKRKNFAQTESYYYQETKPLLYEVMDRFA
ncbi:hypothetical protein K2173_009242 [Erythroxylum novogranatense]|uniref:Photosynthetic NDH subcomplex L 3 n=1 Tax=Erythroxylum novogranatense TaxID=1862640 RepID=A0AAV8S5W3_9ROSI|nr:hypothetical protein K2173_009242 [Erythroxylum novogranatense]